MLLHFARLWVVGLFALVDASFLLTSNHWVGNFTNTIEWANGGVFISGPILVGATVFAVRQYMSADAFRVFGATSWGARGKTVAAVFLSALITGICGHALTIIGGLATSLLPLPTGGLAPAVLLYAVIPLACYAALATLASVLMPNYWGVFASTIGVLALQFLTIQDPSSGLFLFGGSYETVGYDYSRGALAFHLLFVLCLSVATLIVAVVASNQAARARWLPAVALVVVIAGVGQVSVGPRLVVSPTPVSQVCSTGTPQFCVAAGHTRQFQTIVAGLREESRPLTAAGVRMKLRYDEPTVSGVIPAERGVLDFGQWLNSAVLTPEDYASALSAPTDCAELHADELSSLGRSLLKEQLFLKYWLMNQTRHYPDVPDAYTFSQVPTPTIKRLYAALSGCTAPTKLLKELERWDSLDFSGADK